MPVEMSLKREFHGGKLAGSNLRLKFDYETSKGLNLNSGVSTGERRLRLSIPCVERPCRYCGSRRLLV